MANEASQVIAPKSLIIPIRTDENAVTNEHISGQLILSGQNLVYWASGGWYWISGSVLIPAT